MLSLDGPVRFLTTDNLDGDDDDPGVVVASDGVLHVVWFSDRDGTKDLYTVRSTSVDTTTGTITWSPPIQITDNDPSDFPLPGRGDNFPQLLIDSTGIFHLAWHRWNLMNESHILYARSDGSAADWAAATVVNITSGPHFDRFPTLVEHAADDLRIYFGSKTRDVFDKNDIFVAKSADRGTSWGAPVAVASLNDTSEQSTFPNVVKQAESSFIATFVRWKLEPSADFLEPSSDVFYAESTDGETWSVEQVTSDAGDTEIDFVPTFFLDHAAARHLAWSSVALGDPAADIVFMRVSDRFSYPDSVATLASKIDTADHSPEIVPLTIGGQRLYVMIWVRIETPPHNQVVYKVFSDL